MRLSVWSYNALVTAWEPVLEPWDVIAKADLNSSAAPTLGVPPGLHLSVKSTSDRARLTLAYAAVSAALRALRQWVRAGRGGAMRTCRAWVLGAVAFSAMPPSACNQASSPPATACHALSVRCPHRSAACAMVSIRLRCNSSIEYMATVVWLSRGT